MNAGREHGTHACYVWGPEPGAGKGCRCEPCKIGHSTYEKERSRRVAPPYVGAATARTHIRELMAAGVGLKTIAGRSGISHGTLSKLIYSDRTRGMGPSKRIRRATEDRLLAITPADAANGALIPAGPTLEIIAELVLRGWTRTAIARAIGQQVGGLQIGKQRVTARNARAIRALLDKPVPPRQSRWGIHEQAQPEEVEEAPAPVDRYELPTFGVEGEVDWMGRGACRRPEVPNWIFYPGRGDRPTERAAKAVCATCPVSAPCLSYALEHDERGIWGGTSGKQRRDMRRAAA
jgi:WhiB family redox-sensing transcriptional regulator